MSERILKLSTLSAGILSFFVLLFCAGCSSFDHEWKNVAVQPVPAGVEGRWQGVWLSDATHHTGALRCIVTRREDGWYRARFHATYNKALTFGYTVPLRVEPATDGFHFNGQANLGWLAGGVYHYEGRADTTNFFSTYSCKYDHGTFQMRRP